LKKSFLRIFQKLSAAVDFNLIENFRVRKFTLTSPQANINSREARSYLTRSVTLTKKCKPIRLAFFIIN